MPIIHARTRGIENYETLCAYAAFLEEPSDYIVNQLLETVLAKDKDYLRWRTDHPQAFSERPPVSKPRDIVRPALPRAAETP